jgi:sulfur-carrier protein
MQMLYFAWVRECIGTSAETVSPPDSIRSLGALIDWLSGEGDGYAEAFKDRAFLRAAINQDYADWDAVVKAGDEIAIFPPVTGG